MGFSSRLLAQDSCQILFEGNNQKQITSAFSAELMDSVLTLGQLKQPFQVVGSKDLMLLPSTESHLGQAALTLLQKNIPIGCQIGAIGKNSLGTLLHLQPGDIILSVDNISTATVENRLTIYNTLINNDYSKEPILIEIIALRNQEKIEIPLYIFSSSVESYKKSLGILSLEENAPSPTRAIYRSDLIKKQIDQGNKNSDTITELVQQKNTNAVSYGGKKNAYFRS